MDVPLGDAKHFRLGATSFPVVERGGLLWLYTRAGATPAEGPIVPQELEDRDFHTWRVMKRWKIHWTRVMENLLDAPHLPFVHARTIGIGLRRRMRRGSRMELTTTSTRTGFDLRWSVDGKEGAAWLTWTQPNAMGLRETASRPRMYLHLWCVPVSDAETDVIVASARDSSRFIGRLMFGELNRLILWEDQRVVESQQPSEVPPPSEEKSTALDRPTLAFRRWYFERKGRAEERDWTSVSELQSLH